MDLKHKRILVTGGTGFFGSHVVAALRARGCEQLIVPHKVDYDLTHWGDCSSLFMEENPEIVIHLAAVVGGIGANQAEPGRFLYANAMMGLHVLDACRRHDIEKLVIAGTVCAYPKMCPVPFREDDLWNGYPEETNAPYGIAKKMLLVGAQSYLEQYGLNAIMLFPVNLYGPGDHFDLKTSHVIPAMIRKFVEAKHSGDVVTLWGDGSATREFLYAPDAAEAFVIATERYNDPDPINLGTGQEISMRDLAQLIAAEVGYKGVIAWDPSRPNGQPRRCLDTSRARDRLRWTAKTPLADGIRETIAWYIARTKL